MHMKSHARGNRFPSFTAIASALIFLMVMAGCERQSVESYLNAGDEAMQSSKLADAEADYQAAVKAAPSDPRGYMALGNLYMFEQKPGPAEIQYMKVIDLEPKNAAAHAALGNSYSLQAHLGLAEAQYRAAAALDPSKASYRMQLGATLQKENKDAEAEAQFRTAIGLEPKNAHAHLALANLLNSMPGKQAEAQAEYAEVKALDPGLVPANVSTSAPAATPTTASAGTAPPAAPMPKIHDIKRVFLLTHDSPVYQTPDTNSRVVAQVHRHKYVRVTGIGGNWLRIKLRDGTVGFIPTKAAE